MLAQLKRRADSFDNWASEVRQSLEATAEDKVCKSKFPILRWLTPALSQILPTPSPVHNLEFEQRKCLALFHKRMVSVLRRLKNKHSRNSRFKTLLASLCSTKSVKI